jgi:hypothetical protein
MQIITFVCTIFFVVFSSLTSLEVAAGPHSLAIPDDALITHQGRPDPRVAYLMARASKIAYSDSISGVSSWDESFLVDNGFSDVQLGTSDGMQYVAAIRPVSVAGKQKWVVLLAFRGTDDLDAVVADLDRKSAPFWANEDIPVHSGFNDYVQNFASSTDSIRFPDAGMGQFLPMLDAVRNDNSEDYYFLVTGHSLGGAIAKLWGASLIETDVPSKQVSVFTYGAPPVGYSVNDSGKTWRQTYQYKGSSLDDTERGVYAVEYINHRDYVANLSSLYFPSEGYSYSLESLAMKRYTFDDKFGFLTSDMSRCRYVGTTALQQVWSDLYLGGLNFTAALAEEGAQKFVNADLPPCDFTLSSHRMARYLDNTLKRIDFSDLISTKLAETDLQYDFSNDPEMAQRLVNLTSDGRYQKAVNGGRFDLTRLSFQERIDLFNDTRSLGVTYSSALFGSEGSDISGLMFNMSQQFLSESALLLDAAGEAEEFKGLDYAKFAWGTGLNIASGVSDVLTVGSSAIVTKGPKLARLVGTVNRAKAPLFFKAIDIAKSSEFIAIQYLVESGFVITEEFTALYQGDPSVAEFVNFQIGFVGATAGDALQKTIFKNKSKLAQYFINSINTIITEVVKNGASALLSGDADTREIIKNVIGHTKELLPVAGAFFSEAELVEKIYEDIANRPEAINAWRAYVVHSNEYFDSSQLLADIWRTKKINAVISSAMRYVASTSPEYVSSGAGEIHLYLAQGTSVVNGLISTDLGTSVTLLPGIGAYLFAECLSSSSNSGLSPKVDVFDSSGQGHSLDAELGEGGYSLTYDYAPSEYRLDSVSFLDTNNTKVIECTDFNGTVVYHIGEAVPDDSQEVLTDLILIRENYSDGSVLKGLAVKYWEFSTDVEEAGLQVEVISNSYKPVSVDDFHFTGNRLYVNVEAPANSGLNKLTIRLRNSSGDVVRVSSSEAMWSLTYSNRPPVFLVAFPDQLVSYDSEPVLLNIAATDPDGDAITFFVTAPDSVEVESGDNVVKLYPDGSGVTEVTVTLTDGQYHVEKTLQLYNLTSESVDSFYADVSPNGGYLYDGIPVATLLGLMVGQYDPDTDQRYFRPDEPASLAEVLGVVIKALAQSGLVEFEFRDNNYGVTPAWAEEYYSFALEKGAISQMGLNIEDVYPTNEQIAKLIVKLIGFDSQLPADFEVDDYFLDTDDFSSPELRKYGNLAHLFGAFMKGSVAAPKSTLNRADLAFIASNLYLIPIAEFHILPVYRDGRISDIDYGLDDLSLVNRVPDPKSEYKLYNDIFGLDFDFILNGERIGDGVIFDSSMLQTGNNILYSILSNDHARNIYRYDFFQEINDTDGDSVEDIHDVWIDDNRYVFDDNQNGIPDLLDRIYDLGFYQYSDSVLVDGVAIPIATIVENGYLLGTIDPDSRPQEPPVEDYFVFDPVHNFSTTTVQVGNDTGGFKSVTYSTYSPEGLSVSHQGVEYHIDTIPSYTINGDVLLSSGTLDLQGGTLRIKGDLVQSSGTILLNGGALIVEGDYRIQNVTGWQSDGGVVMAAAMVGEPEEQPPEYQYSYSHGALIMQNAADRLVVGGDFVMDSAYDHRGNLSAGVMTVSGNFQQKSSYTSNNYPIYNFRAEGTHKVILNGTEIQNVAFEDSGYSYFNILELLNESEVSVAFETNVSINSFITNGRLLKNLKVGSRDIYLADDVTVNGDISISSNTLWGGGYTVNVAGNLLQAAGVVRPQGGKIVVNGDYIHSGGTLDIDGGSIDILGDYRLQRVTTVEDGSLSYSYSNGILQMNAPEDRLIVHGDFVMDSAYDHRGNLSAGVMTVSGNFQQKSSYTSNNYPIYNFRAEGTHKVILNGTEIQNVAFEDSGYSYFRVLENQNLYSEVYFSSSVQVSLLFNHYRNAFTLGRAVNNFADFDEDGLEDHEDRYPTIGNSADSDGDGIEDVVELDMGLDAYKSDAYEDADNDGLSNSEEYALGTDLFNADSDNDGQLDGYDTYPLSTLLRGSDISSMTLRSDWTTVSMETRFIDPVIIVGPPSFNGADPGVVRIKNVSSNIFVAKFDISFKEWDYRRRDHGDYYHAPEVIPHMILESGRRTMSDGSDWEVGSVPIQGTNRKFDYQFSEPFDGVPHVYLTLQTANGDQVVVARASNVTEEGFTAALYEEETLMDGHVNETLGYLAIYSSQGSGYVNLGGEHMPYLLQDVSVNHDWVSVFNTVIKVEEEKSKDDEVAHIYEHLNVASFGGQVFAQDVSSIGGDTAALRQNPQLHIADFEWGKVYGVGNDWVVVPFGRDFVNPVVVASLIGDSADAPLVVVRNVTPDSFELRVEHWDYLRGEDTGEFSVSYMVAEEGDQQLGGLAVKAGKQLLSQAYPVVSYIDYGSIFIKPHANFVGIMSDSGACSVVPRVKSMTSEGIEVGLQQQEASLSDVGAEYVSWIAIEQGVTEVFGRSLEVNTVSSGSAPTKIDFDDKYAYEPIVIPSLSSSRGSDTASAALKSSSRGFAEVFVKEEQSSDLEVGHTTENISIFVAQ